MIMYLRMIGYLMKEGKLHQIQDPKLTRTNAEICIISRHIGISLEKIAFVF